MIAHDISVLADLLLLAGSVAIFSAGVYLGRDVERTRQRERDARRRSHRYRVTR